MSKKKSNTQLIDPDAPLSINTANGETFMSLVPDNDSPRLDTSVKRRTPRDLGIAYNKANPIMVLIAYELFGFDDHAINEVTGLSTVQLNEMRGIPQYTEIKDAIVTSLSSASKDRVLNAFEQHSMQAVEVYLEALNAPRIGIKMQAADKVLDTLGYTRQNAAAKKPATDGLTIIINTDKQSSMTIEGMPSNVDQ